MIGAGTTVETRFGRTTNGVSDPLANEGGSLSQTTGIGPEGEARSTARPSRPTPTCVPAA